MIDEKQEGIPIGLPQPQARDDGLLSDQDQPTGIQLPEVLPPEKVSN